MCWKLCFPCGDWFIVAVLKKILTVPKHQFEDDDYIQAPDYKNVDSWHCHPTKITVPTLADAVCEGDDPNPPNVERPADCFFVHPTTYFGSNWNGSIDDVKATTQMQLVLAGQASVFSKKCRMYVPKYRQATLAAFALDRNNGRAAMNLAYGDVLAAFNEFIGTHGLERPFILASHSQGGWHLNRLLQEGIQNGPTLLREKLIAVYLVGSKIPVDMFATSYPLLRRSSGPADHTGVVIGWDTRVAKVNIRRGGWTGTPGHFIGHYYSDLARWEITRGKQVLGDNPLSWGDKEDGVNQDTINLRCTPPFMSLKQLLSPVPHHLKVDGIRRKKRTDMWPEEFKFSAYVDEDSGFLQIPMLPKSILKTEVERPKPESGHILDFEQIAPSKEAHHNEDFALFYFEIRSNVEQRVMAYLNANGVGVGDVNNLEIHDLV